MGISEERGGSSVDDYLEQRDKRIAEMWAEFHQKFPTFKTDLQGLRLVKTDKRKKRIPMKQIASRKSSRIPVQVQELVSSDAEEDSVQSGSQGGDREVVTGDSGSAVEDNSRAPETVTASAAGDNSGAPDTAAVELETGVNSEAHEALECGNESALGKFVCLPCDMKFRYVKDSFKS